MSEGIVPPQAGTPPAFARVAWSLAPAAVGVGTLGIGTILLGRASLSTDEAVAVAQAQQPLGDLLDTIVHHEPAHAGFLLVLKGATLVGTDEWAVRGASVLALAFAGALTVVLGTLLLGRVEGLVAGVALGVNAGAVTASREAAPYALGLLGITVATLLLVLALERRAAWLWASYGIACVLLPLTHPLATSALIAHVGALVAHRAWQGARLNLAIAAAGLTLAVGLAAWMAVDRLEAPDGTGGFALAELGRGLLGSFGWNPVLVVAALAGIAGLVVCRPTAAPPWKTTLVTGLMVAPVAIALAAAAVLPLFPDPALVACAPGLALAAGAACRLLPDPRVAWAIAAALLTASAIALGVTIAAEPQEDWRALTAAARRVRAPDETIVVLPGRSRAAFAYYAPYTRTSFSARGAGAWVAVAADEPAAAIAAARKVVRTPRYALLRQFRYSDGLRLQHWVRP